MKTDNFALIQTYHDYACDKETALPDNTRDDLNTDDFFESIDNQQLFFDYQLKKGVSTQRNAGQTLLVPFFAETVIRPIHKLFFIALVHKLIFMYLCIVSKTKRDGERNKNATGCKT